MTDKSLSRSRLVSMSDVSVEDVEKIMNAAHAMKEVSERDIKKIPVLRGKTVINLFMEPSTRTRTSFEIAGKRLSADVVNISASGSSVSKGESLKDMVNNLTAMKPDLIVLRSPFSGAPYIVSKWIACPVVNAGDGRHEHPSQSLLDLFTILQAKKSFDKLNISIIGDILNSRVARSNMLIMRKLGINITVCGPATLLPRHIDKLVDKVTTSLKDAVAGADVVMMLRIQSERLNEKKFPSLREYSRQYCLTSDILKHAAKGVIVMHPGPINRGVEISPEVADGHCSVILDQVTNGVAVRMAILYLLLGGALQETD